MQTQDQIEDHTEDIRNGGGTRDEVIEDLLKNIRVILKPEKEGIWPNAGRKSEIEEISDTVDTIKDYSMTPMLLEMTQWWN